MLVAFMMSGCMKFNMNMDINSDKSMNLELIVAFANEMMRSSNETNMDNSEIQKLKDNGFNVEEYSDDTMTGYTISTKINNIDAIIYGTDNSDNRINKPFVYEGSTELKTNEIAINKNFAVANSLKLGDTVELVYNDKTNSFIIAALVSYPNYVFLFKDGASTASEAKDFAVIEVSEDHFNYVPYNAIYIKY